MNRISILAGSALLGVIVSGATGCATTAPPRELLDARAAYSKAQSGPASQLTPAQLYTAQKSLERAEAAFADDPKSDEARDFAYIAQRAALQVEAQADIAASENQKAQAKKDFETLQTQKLSMTKEQLEEQRKRLASQGQQLSAERQARVDAERRTKEALDRLAGFAAIKEEPRGLVITLSGSVLFANDKTELLPAAQERLNQVADALKDDSDRSITVLGHTDSNGKDDYNKGLSQRRAESVRMYLISRGIKASRIEATGMGKTVPVADNASPEGRANNRRVEIVLNKPKE